MYKGLAVAGIDRPMDTAKSEKAVMIQAKIYRRTPENLDMVQLINVTSIDVHLDINGLRIEIGFS